MNQIEPFKYNYFSFNIGDEVYMHTLNHLMHHSGWYLIKDMYILDKFNDDLGGGGGRNRIVIEEPSGYKISDETYLHLYENRMKYEDLRENKKIPSLDIGSRLRGQERDGEDEYAYYTRYGIDPLESYRHNKEWKPYIYMIDRYNGMRGGMGSGYSQEFHYILQDNNGKEFDVIVTGPLFTIPDEIEEGDAAEKIKAANFFQYNGGQVPLLSSYESSLIEFFEEIYKPTIRRVRL